MICAYFVNVFRYLSIDYVSLCKRNNILHCMYTSLTCPVLSPPHPTISTFFFFHLFGCFIWEKQMTKISNGSLNIGVLPAFNRKHIQFILLFQFQCCLSHFSHIGLSSVSQAWVELINTVCKIHFCIRCVLLFMSRFSR